MTLYEINTAIQECVLIDDETGEVIGIDTEKLEYLQMEKTDKITQLALWIRNLESDAEQLKAEKLAFAKRQQATEKRIDSLRSYIASNMDADIKTATLTIKRTNTVRCEAVNLDDVPEAFRRYKWEPDKAEAKRILKAGGEVPGFQLVESIGVQIKGGI